MKIAVLTNGGYFARLILDKCMRNPAHEIAAVVLIDGDYYGNTGFRSLRKVGRRTYWVYVLYKVFVHFFFRLLAAVQPRRMLDVARLAASRNIPLLRVTTVNDGRVLDFVAAQQADVLLSVSCPQKINHELLATASKAAMNIHSSLLPRFAGLAPYYWVLVAGEQQTGTTVHFMAEAFDQGDIIVQRELSVPARCSAFRLFALLSNEGSEAVDEALQRISDNDKGVRQDTGAGTYFSHPTKDSYLELSRRGHCLITAGDIVNTIKGKAPFY